MSRSPQGRSLELFFIDGKPDGMQTAEEINWTGHVLLAPRTRIVDALKRRQAQHTGVYLLLGDDEHGEPLLYVGESENMADRLRNHDTKKDWWTSAVLITTGANSLHKAHVRYLEARLVEIARSVGRIGLDNGNQPGGASLPEAAENSMEVFLDTLMMVLPAMRIDCFLEQTRPAIEVTPNQAETTIFELVNKKNRIHATAVIQDGEVVVQEGSQARDKWRGQGTETSTYAELHRELMQTGVLKAEGAQTVFTRNYAFKSPSAAGAVVTGRPTNGRIEWKERGTGKTYKEWEAEALKLENAP
jgi:hypothetical protein